MSDASTHHTQSLTGNLGVGGVTFLVVSAAGPLIAMAAGLPVAMLLGNGAGAPAMFAVATVLLLAFAAGFTAMAQEIKTAGGFYAFAARGLGGHAAGLTAAIALFSYTAIQIGLYGLLGSATADFMRDYAGIDLPWGIYSLAALALIAMLGYRQVDLSAKVLAGLVIGEYLLILVLDITVLNGHHAELNAAPFSPSVVSSGAPFIGLLICFTAFIGFEATALYVEEARDPGHTIPRATYISLLLIGSFYVFTSWCMVEAVGHQQVMPILEQLKDPTSFVFNLAAERLGNGITTVMRLLLITSSFAAMLAFHNALARYFFTLGREHLLPAVLARVHARHGSPAVASLLQSVTALIILAAAVIGHADPVAILFARVSALGTLGIVALMSIASIAVFVYFRSRRASWWRTRALPLIGSAGLLVVLLLGCLRFDVLAGGFSPLIRWLPVLLLAVALVGIAAAERLRRKRDGSFDRLGRAVIG